MPVFVRAAAVYFTIVFAIGFVLGTVRVLLTAPAIGELWATVLELPLMLAASWVVCGWTVRMFAVSGRVGARAGMGLLALLFLLAAETILGVAGFGRSLEKQFEEYLQAGPLLGLLAQIGFACFPAMQLRRGEKDAR